MKNNEAKSFLRPHFLLVIQGRIVEDSHFGSFANLSDIVVELMETGVVRRPVYYPRCKDEQMASGTGIETTLRRLPVFANRFLLHKNQGEVGVKGVAGHKALAFRDARRDEHRAFLGHGDHIKPFLAIVVPVRPAVLVVLRLTSRGQHAIMLLIFVSHLPTHVSSIALQMLILTAVGFKSDRTGQSPFIALITSGTDLM